MRFLSIILAWLGTGALLLFLKTRYYRATPIVPSNVRSLRAALGALLWWGSWLGLLFVLPPAQRWLFEVPGEVLYCYPTGALLLALFGGFAFNFLLLMPLPDLLISRQRPNLKALSYGWFVCGGLMLLGLNSYHAFSDRGLRVKRLLSFHSEPYPWSEATEATLTVSLVRTKNSFCIDPRIELTVRNRTTLDLLGGFKWMRCGIGRLDTARLLRMVQTMKANGVRTRASSVAPEWKLHVTDVEGWGAVFAEFPRTQSL